MRIAFVTHQYPPRYNTGTELYAKRLALKIRGTFGHDVRIFTCEPSWQAHPKLIHREETVDEGVAVTRVGMWGGLLPNQALNAYYNVLYGKVFGHYLRDVQPDVVHFFHSAFLGASLLEECFLRDIPTVVNLMDFWFLCPTAQLLKTRNHDRCAGPSTFDCLECLSLHNIDFDRLLTFTRGVGYVNPYPEVLEADHGRRANNSSPGAALAATGSRLAFLRKILSRADAVIAPSETVRRAFLANGYPPEMIKTCGYGVDPMPAFTFDREESSALRVGFIGSINPPKGLHVLVEAFTAQEGDMTLQIHGDPSHFPHYSESCFTVCRRDPRISIRGPMAPQHIGTALRDIDVLVVPSVWQENTPFVVLEACAAGIPVIASNVDGIAEIIHDGKNGRLFPPGDVAALRAILADLTQHRDRLAAISGHFTGVKTLLTNAREFSRLYAKLIAARRPAPVPAAVPEVNPT